MKRVITMFLMLAMVFSLCACQMDDGSDRIRYQKKETTTELVPETQTGAGAGETEVSSEPVTTEPAIQSTQTITEMTTQTQQQEQPTHSPMYISGVEQADVLRWFYEVCLDAEFVNSGDATLVQKWYGSVYYTLVGAPTDEDKAAVASMASFLNGISGFPGMYEVSDPAAANLTIHFVSQEEMINILGDNFYGCDGGVTIWWNGSHQIYKGVICIRTDLEQYLRNSVIKEEIYNGMGPIQDTDLRSDSLIYSGFSTPQDMTMVDRLIMRLLYSDQIRCGMNISECEKILSKLYY